MLASLAVGSSRRQPEPMSEHDYSFASDNTAGVCPEAWEALERANRGFEPSYGDDQWTRRARERLKGLFETDCQVWFVFNGTAANALALSTICARHMSILCHEMSHVDTDECAAPEFFTGGSKVIPIRGPAGKLQPEAVREVFGRGHGIHYPKPGALSLTQSTELGLVYTAAEVQALSDVAHGAGMHVHMDGARFSNAIAALQSQGKGSPADLTWRAGVDVLSFGGTKNGMLGTEAVVFFNRSLAADFDYRVKQSGQLASKMRFAAAQWESMIESGAWLGNAQRANRAARRLSDGLGALPGVRLQFKTEVNGVFVEFPKAAAERLMALGWHFYPFFGPNGYRLMCSWATEDSKVDHFLADARSILI